MQAPFTGEPLPPSGSNCASDEGGCRAASSERGSLCFEAGRFIVEEGAAAFSMALTAFLGEIDRESSRSAASCTGGEIMAKAARYLGLV